MRKKRIIRILIIIFTAAIGYAVFDSIFPKAGPITYPTQKSTLKIMLGKNDNYFIDTDLSNYDVFVQYMSSAKTTRRKSVNDAPNVETYYTLSFETTTTEFRYYIYNDGLQIYIEKPYEGIYRVDPELYYFISEYYGLNISS